MTQSAIIAARPWRSTVQLEIRMGKSTLPILGIFVLLFLGIGSWLHWGLLPVLEQQNAQLEAVRNRLGHIEDSIALLHFTGDPEGQPVEAILKHLQYWSDREERYGSSQVERPVLAAQMARGTKALRGLGAGAFSAVEAEFFATQNDPKRTQYRKRLLEVLCDLDPKRGKAICVSQLTTPGTNPEIRTTSARVLVGVDPVLAGAKLRHVILNETYKGLRHVVAVPGAAAVPKGLKFNSYPGFFNLINYYLRSRDEQKVDVLLIVLRTDGHDIATLQAALDGLMEKKDPAALPTIKEMFEKPRSMTLRNPMLRRKLARAVVVIQGAAACSWLERSFATEADPAVRRVLDQLLKANCG